MKMDKHILLECLKEKGVLQFGEFILKDKSKLNFFISTGKFDDGKSLSILSDFYAAIIHSDIGLNNFDHIHGPAYKGIPIAATICQKLYERYGSNKRWSYDRKEEKDYGLEKEKFLIGDLRSGDRVLIVDDVLTTGKTKIEQKEKLEKLVENLIFVGVLILIDRSKDENILNESGLKLYSVLTLKDLGL
ncbi:orotate phosphoribosyltransferase [Candidatus Pacearchaeota archaeon]|nr:orotate phosphoribosyltransferase [Candidatus Pacearchaeota archaeon]